MLGNKKIFFSLHLAMSHVTHFSTNCTETSSPGRTNAVSLTFKNNHVSCLRLVMKPFCPSCSLQQGHACWLPGPAGLGGCGRAALSGPASSELPLQPKLPRAAPVFSDSPLLQASHPRLHLLAAVRTISRARPSQVKRL